MSGRASWWRNQRSNKQKQQCLADEDARMRRRERDAERRAGEDLELQARFVNEIARSFPGCPAERAEAIARHTSLRGSGRVGRSAAGRSLDEKAVTVAVVASIRHEDTMYDSLLMSGVPRAEARDRVRPEIDRALDAWGEPPPTQLNLGNRSGAHNAATAWAGSASGGPLGSQSPSERA